MATVTKGFRLANRPFLVFDFRALWCTRVPEYPKVKNEKWSVSHPSVESLK